MFDNRQKNLIALSGLAGALILSGSFAINPAPPAGATVAQMAEFARSHHDLIVLGGWSQGIGSLLLVIFAFGVVHLAGAAQRLAGWLTFLSGATILMVSLMEIAFYLAVAQAAEIGDVATGLVSAALIKGVQHDFLVAPALLLPLGAVLLGSRLLPRPLSYLALGLGGTLQVFGLLGLFQVLQPVIDGLLAVQSVWFVAASLALLLRQPMARAEALAASRGPASL